jgi:predicted MPP superfamily phosphohydrolase
VIRHDAGNLVFVLSAAFDALLACIAVAAAARGGRLGVRLAAAAAAVIGVLAVKGFVMLAQGLNVPFGVMHVVWLDLVVVLPLAALLLLWLVRGRAGATAVRLAAVAACFLAPVGAYASFVEPERLVVERAEVELPAERAGDRPLRLGILADLQFERLGDHEREAVRRLMAERPDVILLAGDYHQASASSLARELPALRRLLGRLRAPGGVFAVHGDCEGVDEARRVMAGTGVRVLVNDLTHVRVRGRALTIAGLERDYWSAAASRAARALESAPGPGDVRILLAHRPDSVFLLEPRSRVDLVVAGHTHGGQVQLPLYGPPSIASRVPRDVGAGGLHTLDGRRIYVSRGVGVERGQAPRLRLGAPPEVSVVTLR